MLLTWDLTVPTAMYRSLAISALVLPDTRRAKTSSSRSLNGSPSRRGVPPVTASGAPGRPIGDVSDGSLSRRAEDTRPSPARGLRLPLRTRSSSILEASSTVSEVRIAAVSGVSSPRSTSASTSSRSWLSAGRTPRSGLARKASEIGTAAPRTGTIHQRAVRGTKSTQAKARTKTYRAECQLILGAEGRPAGGWLIPGLVRPSLPMIQGSSDPDARRPGPSFPTPLRSSLHQSSMRVTSLYFAGPPVSEAWLSPVLGRGSVPTIECTCSRGRLFHEPHEGVPTEGGGWESTPQLATKKKKKAGKGNI